LRFIWDYDNLTHIAKHGLSSEEVEHAFDGVTMEVEYQDWHTEERFAEVGVTAEGRFLLIYTTWRDGAIRVVTAFDAPKGSIKEYLKQR
jgi:uncharacterized DUF497 family protein